jgi:putative phosphoesterase
MRVGVLSDTHIPTKAKALPDIVIQAFKEVGHIIHAGDITSLDVLDTLKSLAPVTAVSGNIDPAELKEILNEKAIITLNGYRIGITHGHGKTGRTLDRAVKCFEKEPVDCIIFGHSHIPYCEYRDYVLVFNPGSPTDKRRNEFFSFGILELGDKITAEHVFFRKNIN